MAMSQNRLICPYTWPWDQKGLICPCTCVTNWGCVRGQYHTTMNKHILPINTGDFTHTLHNMTFFQNTLRIHGRILLHIPITTDGFISITGHCRRRYTRFTQLYICPRNTLKIHGRVLWPKPVTTNNFIINTGHCRRLYIRFTLLCATPQNTLKIHGRVLGRKPVTTQGFIFVSHYYWGAGRPK